MHVFAWLLRFLSVAALGIFAGAMLTEGGFLVPYWRSLEPGEFLAWYRANEQRLLRYFSPLTTATGLLALAAAAASFWQGHPGRWLALAAAVLAVMVVASFFVYFRAANRSFATGSVGADDVPAELARWARWHWGRTALSVAALAAAIVGYGASR